MTKEEIKKTITDMTKGPDDMVDELFELNQKDHTKQGWFFGKIIIVVLAIFIGWHCVMVDKINGATIISESNNKDSIYQDATKIGCEPVNKDSIYQDGYFQGASETKIKVMQMIGDAPENPIHKENILPQIDSLKIEEW